MRILPRRSAVGVLAGVLAGALVLTAPAAFAAPMNESTAWKSAQKKIGKQVVAAINDEQRELGGISRPVRCFSIQRYAGKKPWVKVQLRTDQPFATCQPEDGFGTQVWERSGGEWTLAAYESGIGQETCKLMRDFTPAELRMLKRGGLCA